MNPSVDFDLHIKGVLSFIRNIEFKALKIKNYQYRVCTSSPDSFEEIVLIPEGIFKVELPKST